MIIYKSTNKINGKCYIGQTQYDSLNHRKSQHLFDASKGCNFYFHRAIRKYGPENFKWEVIDNTAKTIDELNLLEQKYIEKYKTFVENGYGYNLTNGGKNCIVSSETKKIMSKNRKGIPKSESHKRKIGESLKGKKMSQETRNKLRKLVWDKRIWKGKHHTEETKRKMSEFHKGKKLSEDTKKKIGDFFRGRHISEEHKQKLSKNNAKFWKGKSRTPDTKRKISETLSGYKHTEETKRKMSASRKGIKLKTVTCPYCSKVGAIPNMKRWHFDNCKYYINGKH